MLIIQPLDMIHVLPKCYPLGYTTRTEWHAHLVRTSGTCTFWFILVRFLIKTGNVRNDVILASQGSSTVQIIG